MDAVRHAGGREGEELAVRECAVGEDGVLVSIIAKKGRGVSKGMEEGSKGIDSHGCWGRHVVAEEGVLGACVGDVGEGAVRGEGDA